ncbi:MFS transporter [Pseudarthrobacter sp. TAF60_1]|uniref:MFS transporter n=1 Tax=Pseudarthrobacter sp. TAF60_1 TaxID=3233071 RepID=UPI003F981B1A
MNTQTTRAHHQVTFVVLVVGVIAYALLQSLVTPVLPVIREALGTTEGNVTWVLTAYLLSASIFTPIMGRLGDMQGKKKYFVITLMALALGSALAALATSLPVMIIARVIQGVGGGVLPLAFGIIRDEFPAGKVPGAVGLLASLSAIGAGLGIVLAGPIDSILGYQWLFWIPFIMIAAAAVAAIILVPESESREAGRINWFTAALLSTWLITLLIAISQGSGWGWTSPAVIGLFVVAVAVGVVWVIAEARSSNPLIDMKMMATRAVWTTNLVAFLFGVSMYAIYSALPRFLQTAPDAGYGFGATVTHSGVMLLPQAAFMFLVGLTTGRLAQRFGSKRVLVAGSVVSVIPFVILAFAHDQQWTIYIATAVSGIGFGLAFSSMSNIIVASVRQDQTGVASGMNANIRTIGGAVGAAVMSSIVTSQLSSTGVPSESGYTIGFIVLGGAMVLCVIAGLLIPTIKKHVVGRHMEEPEVPLRHAEFALVAGGTVVGDESE